MRLAEYQTRRLQALAGLTTILRTLVNGVTDNPQTWPTFLEALFGIISERRPISTRISTEWYNGQKISRIGPLSTPARVNPRSYDLRSLEKGLRERGITESTISSLPAPTVLQRVEAATEQHILGAGRASVVDLVSVDEQASGYLRVGTGRENCGFCNMLIAGGIVYKTKDAALFRQGMKNTPYHDNCDCDAVPVFAGREGETPGYNEHLEMQRLWKDVTSGLSGKQAISAWRKYWRDRQGEDVGTQLPVAA